MPKIKLVMEEADYKAVCAIAKEVDFIRDFCSTSFRWGWKGNTFMMKKGEEIIGFAQFSLLKRKPEATLYYLCLKEEQRGKGYGVTLFKYYWAYSKGRARKWKVNEKNTAALAFYRKLGFEPIRQEKGSHIFFVEPKEKPAKAEEPTLL